MRPQTNLEKAFKRAEGGMLCDTKLKRAIKCKRWESLKLLPNPLFGVHCQLAVLIELV
jgi:hypothetical protein